MADMNDPNSWQDSNSITPPEPSTGSTPQYSASLSGGESFDFPFEFIGGSSFLNGTLHIPWTYTPGTSDPGCFINVSKDGGATWVSTSIAPPNMGSQNGTFDVDLTGATDLRVDVSTAAHP